MKKFFIISLLCLFAVFGFVPDAQAQGSCTITTLPFTEGFEGATGGLPNCFTRNLLGTHPTNGMSLPWIGSYQPHTGNNALRGFNNCYTDTSANVPTLIFPELDAQFNMSDMVLEFWGRSATFTYISFVVGVMDDPADLSTFTPVQTVACTAPDVYQKFTVYFSDYAGSGHHIAIKIVNINPVSYGEGFIDDVLLDQATVCSPVLNLAMTTMSGTDVTINWQPNVLGSAASYSVTLLNLDTEVQNTFTTTDTFYTFTGLDYTTNYRAYVEVMCTDNTMSPADSVDFTTLSASVPFPYSENFEGDTADIFSSYHFHGTGDNQWTYGSAVSANAGGHSLYISPDNGATNIYNASSLSYAYAYFYVTFPDNDLEYHFSFDYHVEGEASAYMEFDYFSVYLLDADAQIPESGSPSGTALLHNAANVSDWTHVDYILPNVGGHTKKVVMYWYNNGYNLYGDSHLAAAVDNISIYGNECAQPNNLSVSDLTGESATVSWQENGNATNWKVYYKQANSADAYTEVTVSNDTFFTLTSLLSNTNYEFYVVADCGSSLSAATPVSTFRTACGVISQLPYSEDFESGHVTVSSYNYIACWDSYTSDPAHYVYLGDYSWNAHSGSYYLDFHYTPSCYDIAIMPEMDASINVSNLMLQFFACHTYSGYSGSLGTLEVGVMSDPNNDSTFVTVDTIDIAYAGSYQYVEQMLSFANYAGDGKYIAFRVSNSDNCGFYIDDVLLEERPNCMYPNDFDVLYVGTDSVTLTWTEMGDATTWNIQYGETGFTPNNENTSLIVDSTTYTVGGLDNLTSYDFYVQADCGTDQSTWVGPVHVTTGMTVIGITGTDSLTTCAAIICDNGGEEGDYGSYCDYTLVVYPATEGSGLMITGTCDLYSDSWGGTNLVFIEGEGLNGAEIASYTGAQNITVASSGPITIHFTSGYFTDGGFLLNVACASCTPPTNVAVSNVQTSTATVSWTGDADAYAVVLSGANSGYYQTTGNTLTLNGLTSASSYSVAVRSICGADSSLLSPVAQFTTACDPLTVTEDTPWTEDFESYAGSGNQPFVCWDRPLVASIYDAPFVYCGWSASCHSGANSAEFKGDNAMVVLPAFTNDIHTLQLSFWATSTNVNSGTLDVGVITDITDPNSFELVGVCGQPGPRGGEGSTGNGNLMGPFNFSAVAAASGRIALRYSNSSSSESWNLDDFVVEITSDTTAPVQDPILVTSQVTNITNTSATVNAILVNPDQVPITDRGFVVTTVATGNQSEFTITGDDFTAELTNLTAATDYTVRAFITFNGATLNGNEVAFTTLEDPVVVDTCDTPTGLAVDNVTHESIAVSWDADANVSMWNVRFREVGATAWNTHATTINSYTISGLASETEYQIQVQADCGEGNVSEWSAAITATTEPNAVGTYLETSVTLYPNPAKEVVHVRIDGDLNVTTMEVFDVYGKLIRTVETLCATSPQTMNATSPGTAQINVSGLADGMYFVRVTTEQGVVTKRFVKK